MILSHYTILLILYENYLHENGCCSCSSKSDCRGSAPATLPDEGNWAPSKQISLHSFEFYRVNGDKFTSSNRLQDTSMNWTFTSYHSPSIERYFRYLLTVL